MRTPEPYLTVRAARPIVSGLRNLGCDPAPILAAVGIDGRILNDPDAQFPMSAGVALLIRAVEMTGDDNLGLHLAEQTDLGTFDVHFYGMLSSPAAAMCALLLAIGIAAESQDWTELPLWYHFTFFGLILVGTPLGAWVWLKKNRVATSR